MGCGISATRLKDEPEGCSDCKKKSKLLFALIDSTEYGEEMDRVVCAKCLWIALNDGRL